VPNDKSYLADLVQILETCAENPMFADHMDVATWRLNERLGIDSSPLHQVLNGGPAVALALPDARIIIQRLQAGFGNETTYRQAAKRFCLSRIFQTLGQLPPLKDRPYLSHKGC